MPRAYGKSARTLEYLELLMPRTLTKPTLVQDEIKIEHGIPMPTRHSPSPYPFDDMQVGDSFLFPSGTTSQQANSAAGKAGRRLNRTFNTRTTPEGRRCWRTE